MNYDKLRREDFSRTHRYPYTSAYFYNSELARHPDQTMKDRYHHNPYSDLYPNGTDYWKLLHLPESYHHRLSPWYLTQFSGWPTRWPYSTNNFDKSEYNQWVNDLHRHYARQYESDRKMNDLLSKREAEGAISDKFVPHIERNIHVREGTPTTPPLFLTPSRLYDNADYSDLRRKSKMV